MRFDEFFRDELRLGVSEQSVLAKRAVISTAELSSVLRELSHITP